MTKMHVACVQLCSGRDPDKNLRNALSLIREAASFGATYIQTPEMTTLMELDRRTLFSKICDEASDPAVQAFCEAARVHQVWLHIGSLAIRIGEKKAANRSFVISPQGTIVARYDKIHMFDVTLDTGESYQESRTYQPGDNAVVTDLSEARLGLSICYDLRFPSLYRALAQAGAQILAVPSAFTVTTGKAHWHMLLRARAIETGSFVIAAAQGGHHENGRATFGHSLVVAPWGEVVAEKQDDVPGLLLAELDLNTVARVRSRIPAWQLNADFGPSIK